MLRICCTVLASILLLGGAAGVQLPSGFELQPVLAPISVFHVAFEFLPDGRLIFVHKNSGAVSLWHQSFASPVQIFTVPDLVFDSERGLLDVAVDPQWPARPYIYFFLNHTSGTGRVVLYEVTGALSDAQSSQLALSNPYWILADIPDTRANHKGGSLRFGPQDMLFVSIGDDEQRCPAQDLTSLLGKLLRLDVSALPLPDSGPPAKSLITPLDNPFAGPDENERLVYAFGLRNPYRFDVDLQSGELLIGDVGSQEWEEVNALAHDAGERNFGWPIYEGDVLHPEQGQLPCVSISQPIDPVFQYERGTQAAAVIGGVVYRNSSAGFGAHYDGDFFFYDFLRHNLRRLKRGPTGWELATPVPGQPSSVDWAQELGPAACFRRGPDGALYFLNYRNDTNRPVAGIHRIVRTSAVAAPPQIEPTSWAVQVSPNPASGPSGFAFRYRLEKSAAVRLRIYDATGRPVRVLRRIAEAGDTALQWDGKTEEGLLVAAGVYYYRIDDGDGLEARGKFTIVR